MSWWLLGRQVAPRLSRSGVAPGARGPRGHAAASVTADEPQYLMTAISLGEDHDLEPPRRAGRRSGSGVFHRDNLPRQEKIWPDGRLVSPHDPLLPAFLAVPMLVGGWIGAKLALAALAGVLAAAMVWVAVVRFGIPKPAAIVTVLAFSPPARRSPCTAPRCIPELPAALAVTLAIAALTGPLGRRALFGAGVCIVALLVVVGEVPRRSRATLAAVAAWLVLAPRTSAGSCGGSAAGSRSRASRTSPRTRRGTAAGPSTRAATTSSAVRLTVVGNESRLPRPCGPPASGLLIDRGFGLAAWQPALPARGPGARVFSCATGRNAGRCSRSRSRVGWLNATFVALTMHGWWWPGRQVVVVLPCVVLVGRVVGGVEHVPCSRVARLALGILGVFIFMWLVVEASVVRPRGLIIDASSRRRTRWYHGVAPAAARLPRPHARGTGSCHGAWCLAADRDACSRSCGRGSRCSVPDSSMPTRRRKEMAVKTPTGWPPDRGGCSRPVVLAACGDDDGARPHLGCERPARLRVG